ncbi:MAG: hypothetical protein K8R53_12045 [Bacteroidales bacterium]|nr:hypothetical protein [Bacteroidales bacterium]
MRRWIFSIILLFVIVSFCRTQDIRENLPGAEILFSYNYLEEMQLHLRGTCNLERHYLIAGISFPVFSEAVTIYGLETEYRFFPNRNIPLFDMFFMYRFQYFRRKLLPGSALKGNSIHNTVGYGFRIRLYSELFLLHNVGAGVEKSWFNSGNFTDLSLHINVGIGFNIK